MFLGLLDPNPDQLVRGMDPDPLVRGADPDPLVRGMDPRIRIHTKMTWIRNTPPVTAINSVAKLEN
jgi:hypothetical protein